MPYYFCNMYGKGRKKLGLYPVDGSLAYFRNEVPLVHNWISASLSFCKHYRNQIINALQEIIGLVSLLLPVFDSLRHLWIILCLQVSMFTKNYDHLPRDRYFGLYNEATRANPNYFLMVMWNRLQRFKNICIRVVLIDKISEYWKLFVKTNAASTNYSMFLLNGLLIYFFFIM